MLITIKIKLVKLRNLKAKRGITQHKFTYSLALSATLLKIAFEVGVEIAPVLEV